MASTASIQRSPFGVFVVGAAVSVALGVYAGVHDPSDEVPFDLFFSGPLEFKVWLTALAFVLALVQLYTALRLYGRASWPGELPEWFGDLHRLSGTLAFMVTIPVAYSCLWLFGWNGGSGDARTLLHSILGVAFYGLLASKVLIVRRHDGPSWMLPTVGGLLFGVFAGIFATSALWFWTDQGFPSF